MAFQGKNRRSIAAALLVSSCLALGVTACSSDGSDGASGSTTTAAAKGGSGSEPAGKATEISVLSYNVAGLPAEVSKEHPDKNLPLISPKLAKFDLVLTQEDFDWWLPGGLAEGLDFVNYHTRLWADAPQEFRSDRHPGPEAVKLPAARMKDLQIGDGLAYLSTLEITKPVDRVPWVECFGGLDTSDRGAADCLAMKGFARTTILDAEGTPIDVYNLHGEAGGSEEDQRLQAEDYEQLAAYIGEHSKDRAIILAGDTNLHTDPPGPDAHEDSANGADLEIWNTFLKATGLTDACAALSCDGPGRIDKFAFRSSDVIEVEALSHEFLDAEFADPAGEDLSDHEPLEVRFRLTPV